MSAPTPRVSVVIATYNMARFLPIAVESALGQTLPPHDVHVIDDGSTDDTVAVMAPFLDRPNLTFHRQTNGGQAKAKNAGIKASRGDFVAFLDADDVWTSDKLALQLPLFDDGDHVGVVYSHVDRIDPEGRLLEPLTASYYSGKVTGRLLIDNFVNFGTAVVRRRCFEEFGMFDESLSMSIDYDMWLRFSIKYEFRFLDRITMHYRVWPGQMSHNYRRRYECAIGIMERLLRAHPDLADERTLNEAWAHTFTGRGNDCMQYEHDKRVAFRDYVRALRHRPTYPPAWKGLAKLVLR